MAFRFRFKSILRHRRFLCAQAQIDLAGAQHQYQSAKQLLLAARDELSDQRRVLEEQQCAGIDAGEMLLFVAYLDSLERQLLGYEIALRQCAINVEKAQKILLRRQTDFKMMECLEEKDRSTYRKAQSLKEQKQLDEINILGSFRAEDKS